MKIGVSSMFFGDIKLGEFLETLQEHDWIDVIDMWYDTPFFLLANESGRARSIKTINNFKASRSIDTVTHLASFDINPACYNPAAWAFSLEEAFKSVEFAASIGSSLVVLHGGFSSFGCPSTLYDGDLLVAFTRKVLDHISTKDFDIKVCVENDTATPNGTRPLEHVNMLEKLLDLHPELCMVVDIAHVLKSSTTTKNVIGPLGEKKFDLSNLKTFLEKYAERVRILHVSAPDEDRTHGRVDLASDKNFHEAIRSISGCVETRDLPFIFEYAMETFKDHDDALKCIFSDASEISTLVEKHGT